MKFSSLPLLIMGLVGELPTPDELLAKATAALGGEAALATNLQTSWTVTKVAPDADSSTTPTAKEEVTVKVTDSSYELKVKRGKGHLTVFHTANFDWMQLPQHTKIPPVGSLRIGCISGIRSPNPILNSFMRGTGVLNDAPWAW